MTHVRNGMTTDNLVKSLCDYVSLTEIKTIRYVFY